MRVSHAVTRGLAVGFKEHLKSIGIVTRRSENNLLIKGSDLKAKTAWVKLCFLLAAPCAGKYTVENIKYTVEIIGINEDKPQTKGREVLIDHYESIGDAWIRVDQAIR